MIDSELNELEEGAISEDDIFDCSTNIVLCDQHSDQHDTVAEDVLYRIMNKFLRDDWDGEEENIAVELADFEWLNSNGFFLLNISSIENIEGVFPYSKTGTSEKEFDFLLKVVHKPIRANLYHYEIQVFGNHTNDGEWKQIKKTGSLKGYRQKVAHIIRSDILNNKIYKLPEEYLPSS